MKEGAKERVAVVFDYLNDRLFFCTRLVLFTILHCFQLAFPQVPQFWAFLSTFYVLFATCFLLESFARVGRGLAVQTESFLLGSVTTTKPLS